MFLVLIGAIVVGNIVAAAVGEHEKEEARKETRKAQARYSAKQREASLRARTAQKTLNKSKTMAEKYSKVRKRAEAMQGSGRSRK